MFFVELVSQRVQVSLWYILIGYFGGLSIYHNDTWTLWVEDLSGPHKTQDLRFGVVELAGF